MLYEEIKEEGVDQDLCERNGDGVVSNELDHDPDGLIVVHEIQREKLHGIPEKGFS